MLAHTEGPDRPAAAAAHSQQNLCHRWASTGSEPDPASRRNFLWDLFFTVISQFVAPAGEDELIILGFSLDEADLCCSLTS